MGPDLVLASLDRLTTTNGATVPVNGNDTAPPANGPADWWKELHANA
jgi:hypothetical protein